MLFRSTLTAVLIQNNDLKLHRQWTVSALRIHLHPALLSALGIPFNFRSASLRTGCNNHDVSSHIIVPALTNYSHPPTPSFLCYHWVGNSIFEVFIIFKIFQGGNSESLSVASDSQISSDSRLYKIHTYKGSSTSWAALTTSDNVTHANCCRVYLHLACRRLRFFHSRFATRQSQYAYVMPTSEDIIIYGSCSSFCISFIALSLFPLVGLHCWMGEKKLRWKNEVANYYSF